MQIMSWPFWLMMASMAMAVLPVWRSPMISSRWPRPMGIIESTARMPVCMGSCTGLRLMTPGALNSTGRVPSCLMGPLPSMGMAQRVHHAAEHGVAGGNLHDATGRADLVVLLDCGDVTQKHGADLVLFEVLGEAVNGLAAFSDELEQLAGHGVAQAVDARDAVADLDDRAHLAGLDADVQRVELLAQRLVDGLCGDFSH